MKAADLRERTTNDLAELRSMLKKDLFNYKMKNFVGQLDDTSLVNKTKKDLARIELILSERAREEASES